MTDATRFPLPAVDDHFIREGSPFVVVGRIVVAEPPADEPNATLHVTLAHILAAHLALGFSAAVDMLTRTSRTSDFAPDASVYPSARDPVTGGRQLEELAFEIVSKQRMSVATRKARELVRRGVRRVFCISVRRGELLEWSGPKKRWEPLSMSAGIDDRCFVRPVPVRALLDATVTDAAVVAALDARKSPAIAAIEARGRAAALLELLSARGLTPTAEERAAIQAAPAETLSVWIRRAVTADAVATVIAAP
jgi:hypothetical protein